MQTITLIVDNLCAQYINTPLLHTLFILVSLCKEVKILFNELNRKYDTLSKAKCNI